MYWQQLDQLVIERQEAERKHVDEMEERMGWYEKELNLNPFSWGKNKRSK